MQERWTAAPGSQTAVRPYTGARAVHPRPPAPPNVNAEFQWWLLILGIVIGGALVYLVLADLQGDEDDGVGLGDELSPESLDEDPDRVPYEDEPADRPASAPQSSSSSD